MKFKTLVLCEINFIAEKTAKLTRCCREIGANPPGIIVCTTIALQVFFSFALSISLSLSLFWLENAFVPFLVSLVVHTTSFQWLPRAQPILKVSLMISCNDSNNNVELEVKKEKKCKWRLSSMATGETKNFNRIDFHLKSSEQCLKP